MERRIAEAEARKAELEQRMHDHPSDYVLIQKLDAELQTLSAGLDRDLKRWAKLADSLN